MRRRRKLFDALIPFAIDTAENPESCQVSPYGWAILRDGLHRILKSCHVSEQHLNSNKVLWYTRGSSNKQIVLLYGRVFFSGLYFVNRCVDRGDRKRCHGQFEILLARVPFVRSWHISTTRGWWSCTFVQIVFLFFSFFFGTFERSKFERTRSHVVPTINCNKSIHFYGGLDRFPNTLYLIQKLSLSINF